MTVLEISERHQQKFNAKVKTRLSRVEKIILAIIAALNILAHDKLPDWAKGMSLILKAVMG
jgi:cell division protein FtsL